MIASFIAIATLRLSPDGAEINRCRKIIEVLRQMPSGVEPEPSWANQGKATPVSTYRQLATMASSDFSFIVDATYAYDYVHGGEGYVPRGVDPERRSQVLKAWAHQPKVNSFDLELKESVLFWLMFGEPGNDPTNPWYFEDGRLSLRSAEKSLSGPGPAIFMRIIPERDTLLQLKRYVPANSPRSGRGGWVGVHSYGPPVLSPDLVGNLLANCPSIDEFVYQPSAIGEDKFGKLTKQVSSTMRKLMFVPNQEFEGVFSKALSDLRNADSLCSGRITYERFLENSRALPAKAPIESTLRYGERISRRSRRILAAQFWTVRFLFDVPSQIARSGFLVMHMVTERSPRSDALNVDPLYPVLDVEGCLSISSVGLAGDEGVRLGSIREFRFYSRHFRRRNQLAAISAGGNSSSHGG